MKWIAPLVLLFSLQSFAGGGGIDQPPLLHVLVGQVVSITGGDTFILEDKGQHKIRLAQIDAPEMDQPGGPEARQALLNLLQDKELKVTYDEHDRYGRIIGRVTFGSSWFDRGTWVNAEMIRKGHAWAYRRYVTSEELIEFEEQARGARIGLWKQDHPTPPW